jgi:hypothetical protein
MLVGPSFKDRTRGQMLFLLLHAVLLVFNEYCVTVSEPKYRQFVRYEVLTELNMRNTMVRASDAVQFCIYVSALRRNLLPPSSG